MPLAEYGPAAVARGYNTYDERLSRNAKKGRADFWKKIVLPVAGFATGGAALASMGAGGAGFAAKDIAAVASRVGSLGAHAPAVGSVAAPVVSAGSRIPWMQVGSKAADTLFGVYANRQQRNAGREALDYQRAADARAEAIEADERAEMKRQFDLQQGELKRQWDAQQQFESEKFAASEDERLYSRRLLDEREARRAPYRQASADALARIPAILASGRTSPGMGSLGSYRGGR